MSLFKSWSAVREEGKPPRINTGTMSFDLNDAKSLSSLVELHNVQIQALTGMNESMKTQLEGLEFVVKNHQSNQSVTDEEYDEDYEEGHSWQEVAHHVIKVVGFLTLVAMLIIAVNFKEVLAFFK